MDALLSILADRYRNGSAAPRFEILKSAVKAMLLDRDVEPVVDDEQRAILRELYESKGIELSDGEIDEFYSDVLYTWMSHIDYVKALAELRPLIPPHDVPEKVEGLVRQARNCYALQQYDAVIAICRTLVEASLRDVFQIGGDDIKPHELIQKVSDGPLKCELRILYKRQCRVVHAQCSAGSGDACDVYWITLQGIERLYEYEVKT